MAMGMSYGEFWDGPSSLTDAYRKAHRLKCEMENERAWLHGLYVYDAFGVCLANAFSKRGSKKLSYIEKPIDIIPLTAREKKRRERKEQKRFQEAMEAIARNHRRRKKQKGE